MDYTLNYKLFSLQCTLRSVYCTVYSVYTVQCTVCILYSVQCVYCTVGVAKIFRFTCKLFWSIPTYSITLSRSFSEK